VIAALIGGAVVVLATEPILLESLEVRSIPKLALGWRMTIATVFSIIIAVIPTGRERSDSTTERAGVTDRY